MTTPVLAQKRISALRWGLRSQLDWQPGHAPAGCSRQQADSGRDEALSQLLAVHVGLAQRQRPAGVNAAQALPGGYFGQGSMTKPGEQMGEQTAPIQQETQHLRGP